MFMSGVDMDIYIVWKRGLNVNKNDPRILHGIYRYIEDAKICADELYELDGWETWIEVRKLE